MSAHRARIARLSRLHGSRDPRTERARSDYYAAQITAAVERAVAAAPPFTMSQLDRIGAILATAPVVADDAVGAAS